MKSKILYLSVVICLGLITFSVKAQDENQTTKSNDEIAKELANPNTTLGTMAFPIDFVMFKGDLPDADKQNGTAINFQPSLPIPIAKGLNLFVRPFVPIIISQPTYGDNGFEQQGINLGNMSADVAVGKTWPSKTITILGAFASFPTATNEDLRTSEVTLGPEFMVAQLFKWGALGIKVNHAWGISGTPNEDASSQEFSIMSNVPRHSSI